MFDLKPCIHLDEPKAIGTQVPRAVGDELDCAGAAIADRLGGLDCGRADLCPQILGHAGRRCFLDDLLMTALQRAIAFAEMDRVAISVGENLDLDVARRGNKFLDQHPAGAEGRLAFADGAFERGREIGVLFHEPHAPPAAAGRGLDQHRIADFVGLLFEEFRVLPLAVIAGHDRYAGLLHQRLGAVLQAHRANSRGRRSDKDDAGAVTGFGEVGIFGQESVTGVDALGGRSLGDLDQPFD